MSDELQPKVSVSDVLRLGETIGLLGAAGNCIHTAMAVTPADTNTVDKLGEIAALLNEQLVAHRTALVRHVENETDPD